MLHVEVKVTLKKGVLDPQGQAIMAALRGLNFDNINDLTQGKVFNFQIDESDINQAEMLVKSMCEQLLANTVIENYTIKINADK